MSLNGKRDHFDLADLVRFGAYCDLKPKKAETIIREIHNQVEQWPAFAAQTGVPKGPAQAIHRAIRLKLFQRLASAVQA